MRRSPESKTLLWRSSRWGGRGCWGNSSRTSFMWSSLASGGKGAPLTALAYSAVRSHQTVRAAGSPLPKERAEGGTHRPCAKCKDRIGATQRDGHALECVEGQFCELRRHGVLGNSLERFKKYAVLVIRCGLPRRYATPLARKGAVLWARTRVRRQAGSTRWAMPTRWAEVRPRPSA